MLVVYIDGRWGIGIIDSRTSLHFLPSTSDGSLELGLRIPKDGKTVVVSSPNSKDFVLSASSSIYTYWNEMEFFIQDQVGFDFKITELSVTFSPPVDADPKLVPPYISVDNVDQVVELRSIPVPPWTYSIAVSPDSKLLATGGHGRTVGNVFQGIVARIFSAETGKQLWSLDFPQTGGDMKVSFSPDGKTLATGFHNEVRLFDTATWEYLGHLEVAGPKYRAAFSPDGNLIATWDI